MTTSEILSTKLYIPPTRKELVSRPHLIERLNVSLDRKLTLLSAPAGFGKTTLVSEWIENIQAKETDGKKLATFRRTSGASLQSNPIAS
jgi:ATP/maltotriose-dependent transcriptional regulator MalT